MITPESARRRFALVSFLMWLPAALMIPSMVLLMSERGLGLAEVGLVMTVYSVVTLSLELPTGGLSDVIGRRNVLIASAAIMAAGLLTLAFATTIWLFVLSAALKGVARALSSGPAEAWYVDTLHAASGSSADLKPGLSLGASMGSLSLGIGVLVGGFVPLIVPDATIEPLAVPPILAAVAAVGLLVVTVFAMPEPPHGRRGLGGVLREVPLTVVSGVRLAFGGSLLRRLTLFAVADGVALVSVELLTPGRLASLAGGTELGATAYALVAALGFFGSSAGSALAPRAARVLGGGRRGAVAGVAVVALAIAALSATTGLTGAAGMVSAAGAYVVMFAGLALAGLFFQEMTHNAVTSAQRTTVTSISSLALQAGGGMANLLLGTMASAYGVSVAWALSAGVVTLSLLLFVRMPKSPAPATAEQGSVRMVG
ncbi:MFS transporter [Nonomuraea sp. NPDC050663]|uniref:MFS transporter n=1 Tax=Nonomuraea sp. NPDC050663 TaxID=3364370 RepID=UPI0037AD4E18